MKSRVKSLATPCVTELDRWEVGRENQFFRYYFVKHWLAKLLIIYLTTRDHLRPKPHVPESTGVGGSWNLQNHWISPSLQLGHTQIIFWIEFLRSSRKAFSGNRATSPIFYIGFAHAWWWTIPREHTLEQIQNMIWVWTSYKVPIWYNIPSFDTDKNE